MWIEVPLDVQSQLTVNKKFKFYDKKNKDIIKNKKILQKIKSLIYNSQRPVFLVGHGVRLSGGEKQRLSIARAMLKDSSIILLDEATSSLDAETENKIQKAINFLTKDRTTLVIAHRLSTILNSDKIYVIDNGSVIDEGNHEELIKNSKIYKNFYEKQIRKD